MHKQYAWRLFPDGTELAWCLTEAVPEICPCGLLQGILSRAWRMLVTQSATRLASCNKTWNTSMYRELPQTLNVQAGRFLLTAALTVSRIHWSRLGYEMICDFCKTYIVFFLYYSILQSYYVFCAFIYVLFIFMYFIRNLNGIEWNGTWRWKYDTHNHKCATLLHLTCAAIHTKK